MRDLNRRLDGLEATLAPEGKPFMIWAMIDGRRMTNAEIDAAFQEAVASGRAKGQPRRQAIGYLMEGRLGRGFRLGARWLINVRYCAHSGLTADIGPCPRSANNRHHRPKQKAARRRLSIQTR